MGETIASSSIPKKLREKHGISKRALVVDTEEGVLVKPVPDPLSEMGSIRRLFEGKGSKELIEEARSEERRRGMSSP